MDKIDRLYEIYNILAESGDTASDHEADFLEIMSAAKGSSREKVLACQFIPKFVKYFPKMFDVAMNTQLDLAEDEDTTVRKMAIKHLPRFCKVSENFVPKVADILTQLLQLDEPSELAIVHVALMSVLEEDLKGTLRGIMTQISKSKENRGRKRAIEFLNSKLKDLSEDVLTKEIEEFILESCKKVLPDVSGQEFLSLVPMLCNLRIAKTIPVKISIIDVIASLFDMNTEFDVAADSVTGFMNYLRQSYPLFSPFVSSDKFILYICLKILPLSKEIENLENGKDLILDIFKGLAEISGFVREDDVVKQCVPVVFNQLLDYTPPPPENENEDDPDLQFTHIECLLFTLGQFIKRKDECILDDVDADRFIDLKKRLQFLSRVASRALKRLKESQRDAVADPDAKMKALAVITMNNLNTLIKDFFRSPPSFKSSITLSWKSAIRESGVKRNHEASSSSSKPPKKEKRACRELYVPPGGKYSSRVTFP